MTTPSPIIIVFGGRISVRYALKRAEVVRLDTLRALSLHGARPCDFHNIWLFGIRLKRLPGAMHWFDQSCQSRRNRRFSMILTKLLPEKPLQLSDTYTSAR